MVNLSRKRSASKTHTYSVNGQEIPIGDPRCGCATCETLRNRTSQNRTTVQVAKSPKAAVNQSSPKPADPQMSLAHILADRFGFGDGREKREALYARLELMAERLGWRVEALVQEAAMMAEGKRDEGKYFCRAIVLKMRESGVYSWPR